MHQNFSQQAKTQVEHIINQLQSSFLPNRRAANKYIIVQEIIHHIDTHSNNTTLMVIKIDLHKSFDSLRWDFIHDIVEAITLTLKLFN